MQYVQISCLELHNKYQYKRSYFDNLKAIGIFLVLFGHFLETGNSSIGTYIYKFIYCFHIPLLVLISGYFSSFNIKKIAKKLIVLYVAFQLIYYLFNYVCFSIPFSIDILRIPYWLLWYIYALIFWRLSTYFLKKISNIKLQFLIIVLAFIWGLTIGFIPFFNYKYSLSRIFVFYPFFLLGYFQNKNKIIKPNFLKKIIFKVLIPILTIVCLSMVAIFAQYFNNYMLYGSTPYKTDYDVLIRLSIYIVAIFCILYLFQMCSGNRQFYTSIGTYSIWPYLYHGFIIIIFKQYNIMDHFYPLILFQLLFSVLTMLLFLLIFNYVEKNNKYSIYKR